MGIKRKLTALGYPSVNINVEDQKQVRDVIIWLEDNKIKHYKDSNSKSYLKTPKDWLKQFEKYAKDIQCPIAVTSTEACLDWCIGLAIQAHYSEKKNEYSKYAVENLKTSNEPNVVADNPLDHLDFTTKEFREGVNNLANILKIPPYADPLVTLEACSKVVQKRLHSKALANPSEYIIKGTPYPYEKTNLGFELGDSALNEAAKLLRLLYIQDLRDLQTKVNECIVAVQTVTADPKTDTRLGKVGK